MNEVESRWVEHRAACFMGRSPAGRQKAIERTCTAYEEAMTQLAFEFEDQKRAIERSNPTLRSRVWAWLRSWYVRA